jgi:hypothetical protein
MPTISRLVNFPVHWRATFALRSPCPIPLRVVNKWGDRHQIPVRAYTMEDNN